jgi:hypothetical protein
LGSDVLVLATEVGSGAVDGAVQLTDVLLLAMDGSLDPLCADLLRLGSRGWEVGAGRRDGP